VGTGELLGQLRDAGPEVVGVDWRVPLDEARRRLGPTVALQGNLDPAVCLAPWPVVEAQTHDVLARNAGHPGHVFNLGHGVLPELDPGVLKGVVDLVHEHGRADGPVSGETP
jgi:uroporphyrinogen decarboxylase